MTIIFVRTILIYFILMLIIRLTGKRQLGQLEATDFITTLLISEIAVVPIENPDAPIINALIPIITLTTFEIVFSFILVKSQKLKNILTCRPNFLIKNGIINQKELIKSRISLDELFSEIRKKNITDISEVDYAIIEQDSEITIIPKSDFKIPTYKDLNIPTRNDGLSHIIISNGEINKHGLFTTCKSQEWLYKIMNKNNCKIEDVFLMTTTDTGKINLILKDKQK